MEEKSLTQGEIDDAIRRRGILGIVMLIVPIVSIVAVGLAYVVLFVYGAAGRPADGAQTELVFDACADARSVVEKRLEHMGLPVHDTSNTPGGFTITVTLPSDPIAAASVPATLAAPGAFRVLAEAHGSPVGPPDRTPLATEADIDSATVVMAFLDTPRGEVQLKPESAARLQAHFEAHPTDYVSFWVDGQPAGTRRHMDNVSDGLLDLVAESAENARDQITWVASAAMRLDSGPLPCPVRVQTR